MKKMNYAAANNGLSIRYKTSPFALKGGEYIPLSENSCNPMPSSFVRIFNDRRFYACSGGNLQKENFQDEKQHEYAL